MNKSAKHQFALFCSKISKENNVVTLTDPQIVQRAQKVLRLQAGNDITLFDGIQRVDITLTAVDKKQLVGSVFFSENISPLTPSIKCVVPLLKRTALEEVMYAAVELGANAIQLVFTEKIHRAWGGQKELDRLHNIMIAACEQSKQFMIPIIHAPLKFQEVLPQLTDNAVFFDVDGQPAYEVISQLRAQNPNKFTLLIGPEADLSEFEKDTLKEKAVVFCKLTPTVLRAKQAFALGLGIFRSMI